MSDTATKERPGIDEGAVAPSLARLIKLMGMTTSLNDNEALAFLRRANAEAAKFGTWAEILSGKITVIGDPFAAPSFVLPEAKAPTPQPKQPVRPTPPPSPPPPKPAPKPPRYWDLDEAVHFGKHHGKTIRQIILSDRSYIDWAMRNIDGFNLTTAASQFYANPVVPTFNLWEPIHLGPYAGAYLYEIIHKDPFWVQRATLKLSAEAQAELDKVLKFRLDEAAHLTAMGKKPKRSGPATAPDISDL